MKLSFQNKLQRSVHYEIKVDGVLVKDFIITEPPVVNTPVNVYLGSPWRQPIAGKVKNLKISGSPSISGRRKQRYSDIPYFESFQFGIFGLSVHWRRASNWPP